MDNNDGHNISLKIRVKCVRLYSIHMNYSTVQKMIIQQFNRKISVDSIISINNKIDKFGDVNDIKPKERKKRVTTLENKNKILIELDNHQDEPFSQYDLEETLSIQRTSIRRMLKELKLKPYKDY